jgi:hypothetical protein
VWRWRIGRRLTGGFPVPWCLAARVLLALVPYSPMLPWDFLAASIPVCHAADAMCRAIRFQAGNKLPMALGANTPPESILID